MTNFEGRSGRVAGNDAPGDANHNTQSDEMKNAAQSAKTAPLILDRIPLQKPDVKTARGKAPLLPGWRRTAPLADADAEEYIEKGHNLGARLRADQLVIDADPRNYLPGDDSLVRLKADFGLPDGPTVETGGHELGRHLYFRIPEGLQLLGALEKYPGIEFKTWGRQMVIPPSVHPNGRSYKWDPILDPDMAVPNATDALLDQLRRPPRASVTSDDKWSSEELRVLLGGLDARKFNSSEKWLPIAMACHFETNGDGLEVFLDWGATDPDYADKPNEVRTRWASFSTDKIGPKYTRKTIYKALYAAEQGDLVRWIERSDPLEDFPDYDDGDEDNAKTALAEVRWPKFLKKGEIIKPCYDNVRMAVEAGNLEVGYDVIAQRPLLRADYLPWRTDVGRELNDHLIRILREWVMEQYRFEPGREDLSDVLLALATKNRFNPIVDYLDGLKWDGIGRVDSLFPAYFGAEDGVYERAVGRKLMVAAVRRARRPGAKFDTVPILEGKQGTGKTSALRILGGPWHSDAELGRVDGKDAPAVLQGVWIMELGELTAMNKGEVEQLKAFVSRCEDRYRPPYGRQPMTFPRHCVFVGTTNSASYLRDQTGNRRYLPVATTEIDLEGLQRDRDQLWAEASVIEASGERLTLPQDLWAAAAEKQGDRMVEHPWLDLLRGYLVGKKRVSSKELFESVLELPYNRYSQVDAKCLANLMAQLSFTYKKSMRFDSQVMAGYISNDDPTHGA